MRDPSDDDERRVACGLLGTSRISRVVPGSRTVVRLDVHRLPYVTAIGGCRLSLLLKQWDQAVVRRARPADFECGFTASTWDNVVGLLEPFTEGVVDRFQWLAGSPGEAQFLFSGDGAW